MNSRYTMPIVLLLAGATIPFLLLRSDPATAEALQAVLSPVVEDPEAFIEAQMRQRWSSPERRTWRIDYRPIRGLTDRSSWHIQGTTWWVRFYPETIELDELDPESVYEIDAVALNQNFGVIDFYLYSFPKEVSG